jgi:DNA invertase Pin-like site-specific DNA recombinase
MASERKISVFSVPYSVFRPLRNTGETPIPTFVKICYTKPLMEGGDTQFCSQANQRLHVKESVMSANTFVSYNRVSTVRQGISGLGLEAQRTAASTYLAAKGGEMLAEFTEVESGKKDQRPELRAAIEMCRKTGATLLIAKLDRLARSVAFIANLIESGVRFVAIDMPNADRFMMHVYAAMAEEEGRRISERTRAALASAKARGIRLGVNGIALAAKHKAAAEERAFALEVTLRRLIGTEGLTFRQAAVRMNALQVPSAGGKGWHSTSVFRVWKRIKCTGTQETLGTLH